MIMNTSSDERPTADPAEAGGGSSGSSLGNSRKNSVTPRRRIYVVAAAFAVIAAVAWGLWPEAVRVDIGTVRIAPLAVSFEAEGVTRFRDRHLVSAPVSGWLDALEWEPGDKVRTNQVIGRIRSAEGGLLDERSLGIAIAQQEAAAIARDRAVDQLGAAREEEAFAARELERLQQLADAAIGSERALDAARTGLMRARSQRAAAEDALGVAAKDLEAAEARIRGMAGRDAVRQSLDLKAPADGMILTVKDRRARPVSVGDWVVELADTASMEIVTEVLSTDAVRLRPGMEVVLVRWGGDADLPGEIVRVDPMAEMKMSALGVEEQRVKVVSRLLQDPLDRGTAAGLGDGYRVVSRFILWRGASVRQVPSNALFRHGGGWGVFRVHAGRAEIVPVAVGREAGLWTEILSGLESGDEVVRQPDDRLSDGTRVRVSE